VRRKLSRKPVNVRRRMKRREQRRERRLDHLLYCHLIEYARDHVMDPVTLELRNPPTKQVSAWDRR